MTSSRLATALLIRSLCTAARIVDRDLSARSLPSSLTMSLFAGAARRAASATALWTIPSVAISNTVLPALGASGHLWSPATVTAGVTAACLGVLFPLGAARGGLNAVEHLVVPAVGDSVADVAVASTRALGGDANTSAQRGASGLRTRLEAALSSNDSLHANVMNNTGASGMLTRAAIAMFLPRIDVLMDHVVLASASSASSASAPASPAAAANNLYGVDRATASKGGSTGSGVDGALSSSATAAGGDDVGTLVRVATNGLVAGQIAGARDKVTGLVGTRVVTVIAVWSYSLYACVYI